MDNMKVLLETDMIFVSYSNLKLKIFQKVHNTILVSVHFEAEFWIGN